MSLDLTDLALAPLRRHAAAAAVQAERHRAAATPIRLGFEVRQAGYALQAAERRLEVTRVLLEADHLTAELATRLERAGNLPRLDVVAFEAAREHTRQRVAAEELRVAAAREHLAALAGPDVALALASLATLPEVAPLPTDPAADALLASLDLAEARGRLAQLGRATGVALAERWWPELSVGAVAVSEDRGPASYGLQVEATVPLFGSSSRRAAAAAFDATAARADQLAIALAAEARLARDRVASTHARALHLRDTVLPAQRALTGETLLQYNAMQVGPADVIAARKAELEAELALADATAAYFTAAAALDALLAGARVEATDANPTPQTPAVAASGGH